MSETFLPHLECRCGAEPDRKASSAAISVRCAANDPRFAAVNVGDFVVFARVKDGRVEQSPCWCFPFDPGFAAAGGTSTNHGPATFGHTDYFLPADLVKGSA